MKYKMQIIGAALLLAVFGAMFAVWQFHYKEVFEGYKEDDLLRESLESTLTQLRDNFQGYKPDLLIEEWQNQVQPWRNAREERARFFNFGDWYEIDTSPEGDRMLKFWYTEEINRLLTDFYADVYQRVGYEQFPSDLRNVLGVAREEDWAGRNVSWDEVELNLRWMNFGIELSNWLLGANVTSVRDINVWPRRVPDVYNGMLGLQTVGLRVNIAARDLVRMLDNLSQETRYFTVDALRVTYPYIAYNVEPQLNVEFLLTQGHYRPPDEPRETALMADDGETPQTRTDTMERRRPPRAAQEGAWSRFVRWFRQNVLYLS